MQKAPETVVSNYPRPTSDLVLSPGDRVALKKVQDEVGKLGIFSLFQLSWLWSYLDGTNPLKKTFYFVAPIFIMQLICIFCAIAALGGSPFKESWSRKVVVKLRLAVVICIVPVVGFALGGGMYWLFWRELRADAKLAQEVLPEQTS